MRNLMLLVSLAVVVFASAQSISTARSLYEEGQYAEALEEIARLSQKELKTAQPWILAGKCHEALGNVDDALKSYRAAVEKGSNESNLELARLEIKRYDLAQADKYLETYHKGLKKGRKTLPDESGNVRSMYDKMQNLLNRVEEIEVFDSINVPAEDFFKYYRLDPASGSLNTASVLPRNFDHAVPVEVFIPESRGEMIWSAPDDSLNYRLVHSLALYGEQWDTPLPLADNLSLGGDANYPFMMPDGITLYYASDGEGSLGGYDIYISRRDGNTFLQPQNLGMPYNSPYNDYMLAIDENTGVGWWASDRLGLDGKVTIYMFKPNEVRRNINIDDPMLSRKALLQDISLTWKTGIDYEMLRSAIADIPLPEHELKAQCRFVLPDGNVVTRVEQLHSADARRSLRQYIDLYGEISLAEQQLEGLRERYLSGETGIGLDIMELERNIRRDKITLKQLANETITYETAE